MSRLSSKVGAASHNPLRSRVAIWRTAHQYYRLLQSGSVASAISDDQVHSHDSSEQQAYSQGGGNSAATAGADSQRPQMRNQLVDFLQGCPICTFPSPAGYPYHVLFLHPVILLPLFSGWSVLQEGSEQLSLLVVAAGSHHMLAIVGVVAAFTISAVFAQPAQAASTTSTLVNYCGDKMLWMLGKVGAMLHSWHPHQPVANHVYLRPECALGCASCQLIKSSAYIWPCLLPSHTLLHGSAVCSSCPRASTEILLLHVGCRSPS
jgi:hypothetical protein